MKPKEVLLRLIYRSFLEIREAARDNNLKIPLVLSDLMHNVPLAILLSGDDDESATNALTQLDERAKQKNMSRWLQSSIDEIHRNAELGKNRPSI